MHDNFIDKRRRNLNLRDVHIDDVLPEHFASSYPKFIALLERYYEFQNQNDPAELLNHLFTSRDITETDITLLNFIEDELLLGGSYFQGSGDKRAAANFSSTLFRAKGSKYSIEWFFRSFFNLDPEVIYTKENVFLIAGDDKPNSFTSRIGPSSLRFLTNDKLYQTFALLVRAGIPVNQWRDLFKLFVHPAGMYLGGEVLLEASADLNLAENQEDAAIIERTSPALTITPDYQPVSEGLQITYTVNGTNVFGGEYQWYVSFTGAGDNAEAADFTAVPPQSGSEQDLPITVTGTDNFGTVSGGNTFSLTIANDFFDVAENDETYTVHLLDWCDEPVRLERANYETTIKDVTYTIDRSDLDEDDAATTFTVSGVGGGGAIPDGDIEWYVDHITTADGDFNPAPPSAGSPQTITVSGGSATFTLTGLKDYATEGAETFRIHLLGPSTYGDPVQLLDYLVDDGKVITLNDTSVYPQYTIAGSDVTEGDDITMEVTIAGGTEVNPSGDTVSWEIVAPDSRITTSSGTVSVSSSPQTFTISTTSVSGYYEGTNVAVGQLRLSNNDTPPVIDIDTLLMSDAAPSNGAITGPTTIAEDGSSNSWSFTIQNGVPGSNYYWFVDGVQDADFTSTPPRTGSRTSLTVDSTANSITAGGNTMIMTSTMDLAAALDGTTENESFTIRVYDAASGGNEVANYAVSISDNNITYGAVDPASQTVVEGNDISFTITATLVGGASYENFNWTITDDGTGRYATSGTITAAAFTSGGGSVTVDVTTTNDADIQGPQSLTIDGTGATYGNSPSATGAVTFNDAAAVYELDVDNTSLAEDSGGTFTFDMGATSANIPDGTYNFWLIAPSTGTSAVFTGGSRDLSFNGGDAPTSSSRLAVTITNNQISNVTGLGAVTSIPITVVDDLISTGNLEFRGVIGTTGGSALDTTADLTITDNDTITYDIELYDNALRTVPEATTFVEGDTIYGRVAVSASGASETVTVRFQANSDPRLITASAPSNNITTFTNSGAGDYDFTFVIPTNGLYQGPTAVTVEATSTEASDTQAITINDETAALTGLSGPTSIGDGETVNVALSDIDVDNNTSGLGNQAQINLSFNSGGTITVNYLGTTGSGTSSDNGTLPQTWLLSGSASDYQVQFEVDPANVNTLTTTGDPIRPSAAINQWLDASSTRTWICFDDDNATVPNPTTGTLKIREAVTPFRELATCTVSLDNVFSP